jgi:cell shape-determining protein MreC
MSSRNFTFLAVVIAILIVLIFFTPAYGWKLRALLAPRGGTDQDAASLAAQNETLAAQLAELQLVSMQIPATVSSTMRAMVYSRCPLNFKDELLVDVGANDGVAAGKAVLFQGILVGVVKQVFPDDAAVATVFDPTFKMPVRIGASGVDALLQGGSNPQAFSISKNAKVAVGDIVMAAGPGIPYGLPIGTVASISPSGDNLFNQATLSFAYDVNGIETVLVEK